MWERYRWVWEKYRELLIFLIITIFLILVGLLEKAHPILAGLWDFASKLDTATAVALAFLGFMAYKEYSKNMDEISIYLNVGGKRLVDTKLKLLRKDVSRSEVLGILGMIQKDPSNRFRNSEFQKREVLLKFLEELREVQKGDKSTIEVPISEEDLAEHFPHFLDGKRNSKS